MDNFYHNITLRPTESSDLETLFQFQLDQDARHLAAFMSKDSTDKSAYLNKYTKILADHSTNNQTILIDNEIVGSISKFILDSDAEITYWIDRKFWNQGIASKALEKFLELEKTRPLFGRVAFDNKGSQKVLENSGFKKIGSDKGFSTIRQTEIEEYIFIKTA